MKWFRLWHDMIDNPKIQNLPNKLFKAYINTLCIASLNDPRGSLPNLTKYAFKLRVKPGEAKKILEELENLRLISNANSIFFVHDWDEHQKNSDDIAVRVQRHREKSNVTGNVTETENVTETSLNNKDKERRGEEKEEKRREEKNPPTPRQRGKDESDSLFDTLFWPRYPNKESKQAARVAWKKINPDEDLVNTILKAIDLQTQVKEIKILSGAFCPEWPHPATWLNGRRWEDEVNTTPTFNAGGKNGKQHKLSSSEIIAKQRTQTLINRSKNAALDASKDGRVLSGVEYSVER